MMVLRFNTNGGGFKNSKIQKMGCQAVGVFSDRLVLGPSIFYVTCLCGRSQWREDVVAIF
jgi:hypothetical protein